MAIYGAEDQKYNWGVDWTPIAQTFLGIGDLLNRKKRLDYETGDYIGGNPKWAGDVGTPTIADKIAEVNAISKGNLGLAAPGAAIQAAPTVAPLIDIVNGKAMLTDAGAAAPTGMGALGGDRASGLPGAVTNAYTQKLGDLATQQFIAENSRPKAQLTEQGYAMNTGMTKAGTDARGNIIPMSEMAPEARRKYMDALGGESMRQMAKDQGTLQQMAGQQKEVLVNNIRKNLDEGFKMPGKDIRQVREVLIQDSLGKLQQLRKQGNYGGYMEQLARLQMDFKNTDYGVHRDHKMGNDMVKTLAMAAPRPTGGPGMKPYEVIVGSGSRARKVTVDASSLADAMKRASSEAVRVYGGVPSDWVGKTAQEMSKTSGSRGERFDPAAFKAIEESQGVAAAERYRADTEAMADRNTFGGSTPSIVMDESAPRVGSIFTSPPGVQPKSDVASSVDTKREKKWWE